MDESEEELDSDLETTMQKKYMEQSMQQQKERAMRSQVKTTYNPDYDPERPSYGKNNDINNQSVRYSRAFERSKRRSENDFSLEFGLGNSHRMYTDQTNSNQKQGRKKYKDLSPNSKLIMRSESQFNNSGYGNNGSRQVKNYEVPDDNSFWDKLSRIFTFGCIETSHNQKSKHKY